MNLKEILSKATKESWATGHFNASELDQMRAIVEACKEVGAPAIIGTSEGEAKHLGYTEAVALCDILQKEYGVPVFLNADHHKSAESARVAIDAGYDSVHIDLSKKSLKDNILGTKAVVEYAKNKNSSISVEGELGYLLGESEIQNKKITIKKEDYTKPEESRQFVEATGIDRLAIAVGNIHGLSFDEPTLDIERIQNIRNILPRGVTLVLHAGSGIPDNQIKDAIQEGIANIHINTDIRAAYTNELKKNFSENPDEVAMYKLDEDAIRAMKKVVKEKLKLFGSVNKI